MEKQENADYTVSGTGEPDISRFSTSKQIRNTSLIRYLEPITSFTNSELFISGPLSFSRTSLASEIKHLAVKDCFLNFIHLFTHNVVREQQFWAHFHHYLSLRQL